MNSSVHTLSPITSDADFSVKSYCDNYADGKKNKWTGLVGKVLVNLKRSTERLKHKLDKPSSKKLSSINHISEESCSSSYEAIEEYRKKKGPNYIKPLSFYNKPMMLRNENWFPTPRPRKAYHTKPLQCATKLLPDGDHAQKKHFMNLEIVYRGLALDAREKAYITQKMVKVVEKVLGIKAKKTSEQASSARSTNVYARCHHNYNADRGDIKQQKPPRPLPRKRYRRPILSWNAHPKFAPSNRKTQGTKSLDKKEHNKYKDVVEDKGRLQNPDFIRLTELENRLDKANSLLNRFKLNNKSYNRRKARHDI